MDVSSSRKVLDVSSSREGLGRVLLGEGVEGKAEGILSSPAETSGAAPGGNGLQTTSASADSLALILGFNAEI